MFFKGFRIAVEASPRKGGARCRKWRRAWAGQEMEARYRDFLRAFWRLSEQDGYPVVLREFQQVISLIQGDRRMKQNVGEAKSAYEAAADALRAEEEREWEKQQAERRAAEEAQRTRAVWNSTFGRPTPSILSCN